MKTLRKTGEECGQPVPERQWKPLACTQLPCALALWIMYLMGYAYQLGQVQKGPISQMETPDRKRVSLVLLSIWDEVFVFFKLKCQAFPT